MSLTKKQMIRNFIKQEEQSSRKLVKVANRRLQKEERAVTHEQIRGHFTVNQEDSIEKASLLAWRKVRKLDS